MTQAARAEVLVGALVAPANVGGRLDIAIATGQETPVTSPALELQKALDEMLTTAPQQPAHYGRLAIFGTAVLSAAAVCAGFWWTALSWTASILN